MKICFFLMSLLFTVISGQAYALGGDWQKDDEVSVRLISGVDGVGQGTTVPLGLDVQMAPEWHTYWRSPGMAGLPPQIDWQNKTDGTGSTNLKNATLEYPAPKRYTAYGLETVGYRDHILFPITAELETPGQPLVLDGTLNLLVCSATCVPKTFQLKLTVPEGKSSEAPEAKLIQEYHNQLPTDATQSGLLVQSMLNDGSYLIVAIQSRDNLTSPDIFVENEKDISFSAPVVTVAPDQHSATFKIKPEDILPEGTTLANMKLTFTIVNDGHALEQKVVVPEITIAPLKPLTPVPLSFPLAILFAVIGGFILNLMPCVLPVLSLKIFSAVGHGGGETKVVRRSFLVTAAGILFSFILLAFVTIALKSLGFQLGWGVQFQQPMFLTALVILVTLFAANLWGLLEISLPAWIADGLGNAAYHPKLAGDFVTGAFATLLATPCSAPFLGTAIGFALASGYLQILMIFSALGFGMIIPYLLVAFFPRLATALPKPGAWMLHVRMILGCALAITAIWLIWVLAAQITVPFAAMVGVSMVGLVLVMYLDKTKVAKIVIKIGVVVFILTAIGLTYAGPMMPKAAIEVERKWLPFNENALAADIQEGKTVFVDVTADWCLTCKANQKFVLTNKDISERLFHSDIIAMQADWTNPDPVITDFLHKYGRYGIPFNVVYGPGAEQGIVLPELLSHDLVMNALDKASKPTAE